MWEIMAVMFIYGNRRQESHTSWGARLGRLALASWLVVPLLNQTRHCQSHPPQIPREAWPQQWAPVSYSRSDEAIYN